MTFLEIIQKHKYFTRVSNTEENDGCLVEFPENIFLDIKPLSLVYLIKNGTVELYNNSFKLLSFIETNPYATRAIVIFDVFLKGIKRGIPPEFVMCYKNDEFIGEYRHFKKVMADSLDTELEKKLVSALTKINDDTFLIDKDISEEFNFIKQKIMLHGEILC